MDEQIRLNVGPALHIITPIKFEVHATSAMCLVRMMQRLQCYTELIRRRWFSFNLPDCALCL